MSKPANSVGTASLSSTGCPDIHIALLRHKELPQSNLLVCTVIPTVSIAQDNSSVTAQMNSVKAIVDKIKRDAVQMEAYTRSNSTSWQTHGAALTKMGNDVNELQENMRGLQAHRANASPWQQDAIDRVSGLTNDLATNMNAAIAQLNKSKSQPTAPPYPEYIKANTRIVNDLAAEVDGAIDYGQAKAAMDAAQKQLPQ
jgi:hypothetical protein